MHINTTTHLDGVEIDEDVIKLLEEEETGRHALAARDSV